MHCEYTPKAFDSMKWAREIRDWIYEETAGMPSDERRRWCEARIRTDPFLSELHDHRKALAGRRTTARAAGGRSVSLDP